MAQVEGAAPNEPQNQPQNEGIGQKILVGIILAIAGGSITWGITYWSQLGPSLRYSLVSSKPFVGPRNEVAIYTVELSNTGRKEVEQLVGVIKFPNGSIRDKNLNAPPGMQITEDKVVAPDTYSVQAANLNPDERIAFAFLVGFTSPSQPAPNVTFRGKGVNGRPLENRTEPRWYGYITGLVFGMVIRRYIPKNWWI